MPEYLAPGVYVEEVSYRAKTIEGVGTSTAGFVGPARFGPVGGEPELLTSFGDFERIYGGIDRLAFDGEEEETENYLAHAVRAFFDNGGSRLYVTRVFDAGNGAGDEEVGRAFAGLGGSPPTVTLRARFPGRAGAMRVVFAFRAGANILPPGLPPGLGVLKGARETDTVFVTSAPGDGGGGGGGAPRTGFFDVVRQQDGTLGLRSGRDTTGLDQLRPGTDRVHLVTITVSVRRPGRFEVEQLIGDFSPDPDNRNALTAYFTERPRSRAWDLTVPFAIKTAETSGAALVEALLGEEMQDAIRRLLATDGELAGPSPPEERPQPAALRHEVTLALGSDGRRPGAPAYRGREEGMRKTGLESFVDIEDIAIVAVPGATAGYRDDEARADQIVADLITHVENMKYRVAVLDSPDGQLVSEVRNFRGQFDSKYAALYYPWIRILDPLDPDGRREIVLPPSGYVAGIYARNDVERGVAKAPANEVVRGAIGFELLLNKPQQDVLNPEGVNCFRFFEGRGFRLWGARTISSDPEWKYISNRRYFVYLEHSIDRGTQWAVFENNSEPLWANVRRTVEDFLTNEWRNQALMGTRPEEAFFVRCDRSTMTQNDIDNGRLVCLVGVAVVRPAEFVIFRIGQWTADRKV